MSCISCFFDLEFQHNLKLKCLDKDRFENRLRKYKNLFIQNLEELQQVEECTCKYENQGIDYIDFLNQFTNELINQKELFIRVFDELIEIYMTSISKNQKLALEQFWTFFQKYKFNHNDTENSLSTQTLWFRCREKKNENKKDIYHFFHIPFDKRYLVSNQRFSISGQPMLYFGNSLYITTKELENSIDDLEKSAFLPNNNFYNKKIFSLKNTLFELIENSIKPIINSGSKLDFKKDYADTFLNRDIIQNILSFVCTFHKKNNCNHKEEYILPQMLTALLLEHNYDGIIYPSTKNLSDLNGVHKFSNYNLNLALFVKYSNDSNYDNILLDSFSYYIFNGEEKYNLTLNDINLAKQSALNSVSRDTNNNDYLIPRVLIDNYINYLKDSIIDGEKYFDSTIGKVELELIIKMLDDRIKI
jgi:hypothetical protein